MLSWRDMGEQAGWEKEKGLWVKCKETTLEGNKL